MVLHQDLFLVEPSTKKKMYVVTGQHPKRND